MFIDTHTHIQFSDYDTDRAMVIGNAKKAGVKKCIVPGTDIDSSIKAIRLSEAHPGVIYAAAGFHPYEAQAEQPIRELEKLICDCLNSKLYALNPLVAVGECGLDYHLYKGEPATSKKDNQKKLLYEQGLMALKYDLPMIIHIRDAFEDTFSVLDSLPSMPRGVVHCFSGGLQEARLIMERNLYMGVDGNLTYSKQLQSVIPQIPPSSLLLETDAPYLTPIPHRGTRNEPKYIPLIAKALAFALNIPEKSLEETIYQNSLRLFPTLGHV